MSIVTLQQVASWLNINYNNPEPFIGCSIDSRTLQSQQVFLAMPGTKVKGSDFIEQAFNVGASVAIVDNNTVGGENIWQVPCVYKALNTIAINMRKLYKGKIIAITGSCGKTTVRHMISELLALSNYNVFASFGNFNNHLGVPLMLSRLTNEFSYAVLECGASAPNEIAPLVELIQPHVAVLNNVHAVHMEGFGSIEAIAITKGEIFSTLTKAGTAIMPYNSEYQGFWRQHLQKPKAFTFGIDSKANYQAKQIKLYASYSKFILQTPTKSIATLLAIPGKIMLQNLLASVAAVAQIGVDIDKLQEHIPKLRPYQQRLQFKSGFLPNIKVLDDSYNSNPTALQAAVEILLLQKGRPIVIMGDMGETGNNAKLVHVKICRSLKAYGIKELYTVGELSNLAADSFGDGGFAFLQKDKLITSIKNKLCKTSEDIFILIKGSRFTALEEIVSALTKDST